MQFGRAPLLEKFIWKKMDFAYPDERSRQLAIASGEYVPENSLPVGIEIWRNKLFVTIPRWRDGKCPKYYSLLIAASLLSRLTSYDATDKWVFCQKRGAMLQSHEPEADAGIIRGRSP